MEGGEKQFCKKIVVRCKEAVKVEFCEVGSKVCSGNETMFRSTFTLSLVAVSFHSRILDRISMNIEGYTKTRSLT